MASRKLEDLDLRMHSLALKFLAECKKQGYDVLVTCTYRSNEEQASLYAQGRTKPGAIVTNAKPGESLHNRVDVQGRPASLAFDVVPLVDGKCVWDSSSILWKKLGEIGVGLGLDWAGTWKSFKEYPHFQLKGE